MEKQELFFFFDVLHKIPTPTVMLELKTFETLFMNEAALELFGVNQEEFQTVDIVCSTAPTDKLRMEACLSNAEQHSSVTGFKELDVQIKRKSGRRVYVNITVSKHSLKQRNVLILTLDDLTELKKMAEHNQQIQGELFRVTKLADLGRLSAGVAHEINNPLNVILAYAENLRDVINEGTFNQIEYLKNIDSIIKSVDRVSKITNKMTQMARFAEVELQPTTIDKVVRDALIFTEQKAKQLNIQMELNLQPLPIHCDVTRIEQVIINLVNNAIYALQNQKTDRIIRLTVRAQNEDPVLEIWNNGELIPESAQQKLFTPFYTSKPVGEGTGLGLFLVFGAMEAHKGSVSFYSDKSKGTAFLLKFPKLDQKEVDMDLNTKILVVEDDLYFREIVTTKLRKVGFVVIEASNGEEGLKNLKENPDIKVVFVDYKMRLLDGVQFIEQARSQGLSPYTVMVTGYGHGAEIKNLQDKNWIQEILHKPVSQKEIEAAIAKIKVYLSAQSIPIVKAA